MVRYDHICLRLDRFSHALRREGQAGHQPLDVGGRIAQQQPGVIPTLAQGQWSEPFEPLAYI